MSTTVNDLIGWFEEFAPQTLQEEYDNCGLQVGDKNTPITAVLLTLDITNEVVDEAIQYNCNVIVAHHPLIFKALKKITPENHIQNIIIRLIKNNISLFIAHTNIDNVIEGVNSQIADKLELTNRSVLLPLNNSFAKIITFIPEKHATKVQQALFEAGAGTIGNYDCCSFTSLGKGSFRAKTNANPFVGEVNKLHTEPEVRIEMIFPKYLQQNIIESLIQSHPYEEPAYDVLHLENANNRLGAGLVGWLPSPMDEIEFLEKMKKILHCEMIKHTKLRTKKISKVALCGGSGAFLIKNALNAKADIFITGDLKYHDYFEANESIVLADFGHFETEQYTKHIFYEIITKKMPKFVVRISETKTNPINYL